MCSSDLEEFGAPFRLLKFGFILLGGWLGIFGMALGTFLLAGHLAGLMSFGIPYLMPFVGKGLAGYHAPKDSVWRPPLHQMRERPYFNSAASTPRSVFGKLFSLSNYHLKKLMRDGNAHPFAARF